MSKFFLAAVVVAVGCAGLAYGDEPMSVTPWGQSADPWRSYTPSGLRFTGEVMNYRTAGIEGVNAMGGAGGGWGGCDCQNGYCAPWYYLPWYASWSGHGNKIRKHQGGGCYSCGY